MKIIAIRHGQTDWNSARKVQGKTDIPLNKQGLEQARKSAKALLNAEIEIIISSPLKRALETAEVTAKSLNHNVNIICDSRLVERNFGDYEGLLIDDVDIIALRNYTANHPIPNGETIREVVSRVFECLDEILNKYKGQNILLVTHGHVMRAVFWYFNGLPQSDENPSFKIDNCEIYEFTLK